MNCDDQSARRPSIEPYPPLRWRFWAWPMATLPDYKRDRRSIAYHEAGHLVLLRLLNIPMRSASVSAAGDGEVVLDRNSPELTAPPPAKDTEGMEHAAIMLATVYVGGHMAELLLHGLDVQGWLNLDTDDWRRARWVLRRVFEHDLGLYYCQRLARAVLTEHWDRVEVFASMLEATGAINTDDIEHLWTILSPDSGNVGTSGGQ